MSTRQLQLLFMNTSFRSTNKNCDAAGKRDVDHESSSDEPSKILDLSGLDSRKGYSDRDQDDAPGPSSKRHHDQGSDMGPSPPKTVTFDPTEIFHPRSTNWIPLPEVANYVHSHLRQGFDKEVTVRLKSECPRLELDDKMSDTPEVDPTMVNFMKKWARDPKKELDRAWRSCLDKLLDIAGPLTKILELGFITKDSGVPVDQDVLIGLAQRAVCQLGNAIVAMSTKRRRLILMHIDPKLNDLASSESSSLGLITWGSLCEGPGKVCSDIQYIA
ncbi:hypothetical protein NDU88_004769 [Pleurodeles waltl]|uniref:Uncharacterized protein n=1 Tax=Pleurodeles waltl TaxID=8319 RepID=A0AAV7MUG1_PLEWA|nr:hypothetical protein NDU88_004769 [Pleurodeles waltl]